MTMIKRLSMLLVVALLMVACGSDETAGSSELPGEPVCIPEDTETPAPEYLGLDEVAATALADEQGLDVREVGRDGECFAITMDLRPDRINLEYVDGLVVGAAIF